MHSADIIRQVAALHMEGLKDGFLAKLGPRFLSLLYRAIDEDENSTLIVEMDGAQVAGFVTGGSGMGSIYKKMLRNLPQLMDALGSSLVNPKRVFGILEIVLRRKKEASEAGAGLPDYELFSIVVASEYRGKGVSERLYKSLIQYFTRHGIDAFKILVGKDLQAANKFYSRMGAVPKLETSLHKGENSTIYVQHLSALPDMEILNRKSINATI